LNRKELIVVGIVLLASFITGASASGISSMFITNNPLNVKVVRPPNKTTDLAIAAHLVTDIYGTASQTFINATGNYQGSNLIILRGSVDTTSNITNWMTVAVEGGVQGLYWNVNRGPADSSAQGLQRLVFTQQIDTSYDDLRVTVSISPNCVNGNLPASCYQNVPISLTVLITGR